VPSLQHEFANCAAGFAQLAAWLQRQDAADVHACLEATGVYGEELARFLHQAGHRVSVVHPRPIRAFAASELARNKTDPLDAGRIARFCQAQRLRARSPPPPEIAEREALVRRLDALEQMRQQEAMRKLLYLAYGILGPASPLTRLFFSPPLDLSRPYLNEKQKQILRCAQR